ncbi:MAG TPA: hypothetical protein VND92_06295 [Vicinamibacterales bacterium]|nr:hypothetical protein [Vicinamibacterales bacterium]
MRRWRGICLVLLFLTACRQTPIGRSPSTFVPAQTLTLQDASGRPFGTLSDGTDGSLRLTCHVAAGATDLTVTLLADGQLLASLGTPPVGRPSVSFAVGSDLAFGFLQADGRYETLRGRRRVFGADSATVRRMAERLYHLVVPWTPGVTLDDAIPDQDAQFVDKRGRTFAVLGLSSAAEPSFALVDAAGRLRVWVAVAEQRWIAVKLLDARGDVRVAFRFGPQPMPHVTVWDHADPDSPDRLTPYALDPATRLETVSASGGWLTSFQHDMVSVTLPVRLVDQRGRVVWEEK